MDSVGISPRKISRGVSPKIRVGNTSGKNQIWLKYLRKRNQHLSAKNTELYMLNNRGNTYHDPGWSWGLMARLPQFGTCWRKTNRLTPVRMDCTGFQRKHGTCFFHPTDQIIFSCHLQGASWWKLSEYLDNKWLLSHPSEAQMLLGSFINRHPI